MLRLVAEWLMQTVSAVILTEIDGSTQLQGSNTRLKVAAVLHIMSYVSVLLDLQVIFNKLIGLVYRGLDISSTS